MIGQWSADPVSGVGLDPVTLGKEGSAYHVRLEGDLSPAWIRSYLSLWAGLAFFSRFDLDVEKREISFRAPDDAGPSDAASLLEIIRAMLRLTSRCAVRA